MGRVAGKCSTASDREEAAAARSASCAKDGRRRLQPRPVAFNDAAITLRYARGACASGAALIDDGIPKLGTMGARLAEAPAAQLAADQVIEVSVSDECGRAVRSGAGDENVGSLHRAMFGFPVVLDFGMISGMPQDARHHRPFWYPHS